MKNVRTRFAPTPSGLLHIGNAVSFTITAALAKKLNADILLRIDDLDTLRIRDEFVADVFDSLQLLNVSFQEGPRDLGELKNEWSQLNRIHLYQEQLTRLVGLNVLYPCSCSRKDLDEIGGAGSKNHKCKIMQPNFFAEDASWRIRLPDVCKMEVEDGFLGSFIVDLNLEMPDFVVRRMDGIPGYQLASLVDDVHFDINLIVRGEDLKASTAAQFYLASLLSLSTFSQAQFYHHPLIPEKTGVKLSKSEGSLSLMKLAKSGELNNQLEKEIANLIEVGGERFSQLLG